jgi:hypothetical protein
LKSGSKVLFKRLLKNAYLQRSPSSFVACALKRFGAQASLRRTTKYASPLRTSGALHLGIFEHPAQIHFFRNLLKIGKGPNQYGITIGTARSAPMVMALPLQ